MIYLNGFTIPDESAEWNFFVYGTKETCFNTYYPYQIFPKMEFEKMTFETVTIFYGGNGTGKTTLLNIIAEKLRLTRNAVFNRSSFFERYVSSCRADIEKTIPNASRIITSDDVFDAESAGYAFEKGRQRAKNEVQATRTYTYQPAPKKKSKIVWWVLGWIFIFPIPLTIIIARNKKLKTGVKVVIIIAAWLVYLLIGIVGGTVDKQNSHNDPSASYSSYSTKETEIS